MIPVEQLVKGKWYRLHVCENDGSFDAYSVLCYDGEDEKGSRWSVAEAGVCEEEQIVRCEEGFTLEAVCEMAPVVVEGDTDE